MLLQPLKGFRDFLPKEKRKRDIIIEKLKKTFTLFGFEPLETPTLEYADLLLGKYGKEADKLIYTFTDKGGREVALKYDQTVPTARILAQYQNQLPKFFRRYQIQNVFRAEKPQKGRFREFTQCDIDIFGSLNPVADAEIVATTYFAFKNLNFPPIKILVNDRQLLINALSPFTNNKINVFSLIQTIDKLEKLGEEKTKKELIDKGIASNITNKIFSSLKALSPSQKLKEILQWASYLGVPQSVFQFQPTLARGLDYYTGIIFEVILPNSGQISLAGGGRYDNLIKQLAKIEIPAVGVAFGLDRIIEATETLNISLEKQASPLILITLFNEKLIPNSLLLAQKLRSSNISCQVYPAFDKLEKQLKYANKNNFSYVIIIGPEEAEKNLIRLKNMKTSEQKTLSLTDLIKNLK